MLTARKTLQSLLEKISEALAPATVGLEGDATIHDDPDVLLTPVALRRVGRSRRRETALLDLELTVSVVVRGPAALDHLENLLILAETSGYPVTAPAATTPNSPPVLGLTFALPVTVVIDEPTGPPVETVVVDLRPSATRGSRGVPVDASSGGTPADVSPRPPEGS